MVGIVSACNLQIIINYVIIVISSYGVCMMYVKDLVK